HDRLRHEVALGEAEVELIVETRDAEHMHRIRGALQGGGYTLLGTES
ncbi:MAG: threonine ammonia-lyase, partial [Bacillota bacterium]